ncbi:MAG TPA: prepilin peptidase [Candidatus Saccharimonadales bacterium]
MESFLFILVLGLLGLCFGSFVNAAVWRIKNKKDLVNDRSECTDCHHKLAWYDLIPVVSWVLLRGKCRYCGHAISIQYPLVELALAIVFIISYLAWPYELQAFADWSLFGLWLAASILLAILFVYDMRWFLLPDKVMYPLIVLGGAMAIVKALNSDQPAFALLDAAVAVTILSGLYLVLFLVSKGKWVGFGDVKLGLFLGLALGESRLALFCLFLANILGCLLVVPGLLTGRIKRHSKVPFGPFLILGFLISLLWGGDVLDWYLSLSFSAYM